MPGTFLAGLDVSQAFMNSPLERPEILRMPLSMSTMKGELIFLWAEKGINGLRIASQAWIIFFSSIVKSIGVVSGTVEPCLYVGRMVGKDQAPIVIMAYVDDLLVATFGISPQDTHDCTVSSCQGSRDWPRWFERGTLAFPWSKYLSKARLICFVHAGGSNILG